MDLRGMQLRDAYQDLITRGSGGELEDGQGNEVYPKIAEHRSGSTTDSYQAIFNLETYRSSNNFFKRVVYQVNLRVAENGNPGVSSSFCRYIVLQTNSGWKLSAKKDEIIHGSNAQGSITLTGTDNQSLAVRNDNFNGGAYEISILPLLQ